MIPAAAAAVLYGAVLAASLFQAGRVTPLLAGVATAAGALCAVALWRGRRGMLGWSLLIAGAVFIVSIERGGGGVDGTAPLVATALFLCAELARWSFDTRVRISGDAVLLVRRAAALAALALGAGAAASVVVGSSAIAAPHNLAWTALGAAAAAGAAGLGVWLARR